jgi:hypothetical protein
MINNLNKSKEKTDKIISRLQKSLHDHSFEIVSLYFLYFEKNSNEKIIHKKDLKEIIKAEPY